MRWLLVILVRRGERGDPTARMTEEYNCSMWSLLSPRSRPRAWVGRQLTSFTNMNWTQNITALRSSLISPTDNLGHTFLGTEFLRYLKYNQTTQSSLGVDFKLVVWSPSTPAETKIMMGRYWVMNSNANNLQSIQSIAVKPSFIVSLYSGSKICNNFSSFPTALMMAL